MLLPILEATQIIRANLQTALRGNTKTEHNINCRHKSNGYSQALLSCYWNYLVTFEPSWQENFTVEAQRVSTGNTASLTTQIHNRCWESFI